MQCLDTSSKQRFDCEPHIFNCNVWCKLASARNFEFGKPQWLSIANAYLSLVVIRP